MPAGHNGDGHSNGDRDTVSDAVHGITITAQDLLLAYEQVQFLRTLKPPVTEIL